MKQVKNMQQLKSLSFFDVSAIGQVTFLQGNYLYESIARWINAGILLQLKKGFYTTNDFYKGLLEKDSYAEFLANKLKYPSYLSLEYVLSKNSVLSESVYTYTSVTRKKPQVFVNSIGSFSYRNISEKLFLGFEIYDKEGFEIAIASKSKALFDYLYLKFFRKSEITKGSIEELRLNLDEFSKKEIKEFAYYCNLTKISKYAKLPKLLFEKNDS
jgi:predicted transcriptional regulator of viral defense system